MNDYKESRQGAKQEDRQEQNRKTGRNKRIVRVLLVTAIVVIILLLVTHCGKDTDYLIQISPGMSFIDDEGVPAASGFGMGIDPNAGGAPVERSQEEIVDELNRMVKESNITISMSTEPVFETGTSLGTLNIENDPQNRHAQVVQIYLSDTDELIYQSGMIPVGQWVTQGKLLKDLDAGVYPCRALFNVVDDEGNILGQAATNINIRVLG